MLKNIVLWPGAIQHKYNYIRILFWMQAASRPAVRLLGRWSLAARQR